MPNCGISKALREIEHRSYKMGTNHQ